MYTRPKSYVTPLEKVKEGVYFTDNRGGSSVGEKVMDDNKGGVKNNEKYSIKPKFGSTTTTLVLDNKLSTMDNDIIDDKKLLTISKRPKGPARRRPNIIGARAIPSTSSIGNIIDKSSEKNSWCENLLKVINENEEIVKEIKKCKENESNKPLLPLITSKEEIPEDFDIMAAGAAVKLKKATKKSSFPDVMLIKVQGTKDVVANLVSPYFTEIHKNASFLLVTEKRLFLFKGSNSNVLERTKVTQMISDILANNELNCDVTKVDIAEENEESFWNLLKGKGNFNNEDIKDENREDSSKCNAFYEINDDSGKLEYLSSNIIPSKRILDPKKLIICDFNTEIYLWIGKLNSKIYINSGLKMAEMLKNYKINSDKFSQRPDWIILRKITSGLSDCLFNGKFVDLKESSLPSKKTFKHFREPEKIIKPKKVFLLPSNDRKFNESDESLAKRIGDNLKEYPLKENVLVLEDTELKIDDKNLYTEGLKFYKLIGDKMKEIERDEEKNIFEDNQCYIIQWKYRVQRDGIKKLNGNECDDKETGRQRQAYFYWIGKYCKKKEQGLCALALRKIDNQRIAHVRVEQGKEIPLFRSLFNGKLVIVSGDHESDENCPRGGKTLYIVRGGPEIHNMIGEQIYSPFVLNQQTCYLEKEGDSVRILRGDLASKNICEGAERLARSLSTKILSVCSISSTSYQNRCPQNFEEAPRIFRIFDKDAEETYSVHSKKGNKLFTFEQDDLCDTMIVDQGKKLWVWSYTFVTTFALQVASSYWKDREGSITVLHRGKETESFKALFPTWNDFEDYDKELPNEIELSSLLKERTCIRSLKDVQERKLPQGSDLSCLEKYLSDVDFEEAFKMSREKFNSLHRWKQIELKKAVNLF
uniref:HP domain-containing protein n=1 Tax=Parastrongyloides trichosuri TaxID=131310 RepID=A0A0N4Z9Y3_PARTI